MKLKMLMAGLLMACSVAAADSAARPEDFACPVGVRNRGHENIEWQIAYGFHLTDAKRNLPRALLVGDSICNQHQGGTIKKLDGKINISYWISSYCVSSPKYLKRLALQLDEVEKWDFVYFNNGLHSLDTDPAVYEKHYDATLAFLKARLPKTKIIVVTSTMVADAKRCEKVKKLNEIVKRLAAKHGLQVDDLGALTDAMPRANLWRDGVHFGGAAVNAISDHASKTLVDALQK